MANVVITLRIMPEDPKVSLEFIENSAREKIKKYGIEVHTVEKVPIAFGLVALDFIMLSDEKKGDTEQLEKELSLLPGINSVQVTDVRRAVG